MNNKSPGLKKKKNLKGKKKINFLPKQLSHSIKPELMTESGWQTALRKQIAEKETFDISNIGTEKIYSDFSVYSHHSNNTYKVALRSKDNLLNFCSCPDFKTNLLGTCKHIEVVRLSLLKKRGLKPLFNIFPELSYSSIYLSYFGKRTVKLRIGSENKTAIEKWSIKYFDSNFDLYPAAYFDIEKLLSEAEALSINFRFYPDALEFILEQRDFERRISMLKKKGESILNGITKSELFPYQKEGIFFITKAGRSILADDMGLGKTLQAITWAMVMQKHFNATKVVIVCPTSLKYQWKTEIEKFTDSSSCVIEGNQIKRKQIYKSDENFFNIVSYHVAGNDWQYINQLQPDIIIIDEAQRIKNWRAKISQNIKRLKSPYTLVLTGTPVENNIEELYSLTQYVNPYLLGSLHHFLSAHQIIDVNGKVIGYKGLNEIGEKLSEIMLRRRKKEVLPQLPLRMDKNLIVPISDQQMQLHKEFSDNVAQIVNKWKRFGFLNEKDRQNLLNCLNMMRMVCNSTYILDQETNHQTKLDELFNILDELLLNKDEKVVIFSQWERMTRLIAQGLTSRNIKFENLHGGIHSKNREALFKNFNNDPECKVFLSTDAGGVGLNLQSASNLINMDIPWNPAVLEQRIGRIYRLGQKKNITITNIIAKETIEERMLSVLKFKSSVAAGILDNGEDNIFAGDDKFKKFMQNIEDITQNIPIEEASHDHEEKEEISESYVDSIGQIGLQLTTEDYYNEIIQEEPVQEIEEIPTQSPQELIGEGINFISKLVNTLKDPVATKALTDSLIEKDPKTGQSYLKIPVQNTEAIENGLMLLAKLFVK